MENQPSLQSQLHDAQIIRTSMLAAMKEAVDLLTNGVGCMHRRARLVTDLLQPFIPPASSTDQTPQ